MSDTDKTPKVIAEHTAPGEPPDETTPAVAGGKDTHQPAQGEGDENSH
ncbi:hypothetical protein [Dermatophilus congolensis]|nr:hypothetical protein [Dermatophilus congolensis]MBO3143127.1 hypothetical protein [Dermatophilus congolensis]MBO3152113.1 hypothetical protein [Dermatophilus congolensis]MBO3160874.1 hypothetical protein [Dermatophilus congolensis]MBO3163401.1 hypothetical protein [Dermatophilus congolensis]MBO3176951.1 hypothetical protein [Dermatophilus congolensis]